MRKSILLINVSILLAQPVYAREHAGFWLGMDSSVVVSDFMHPTLSVFKKEHPSLHLVLITPAKLPFEQVQEIDKNLGRLQLPGLFQTIGVGAEKQPEIVWEKADYSFDTKLQCGALSPSNQQCCNPAELCGTLHMAAMTGNAYREIWRSWLSSAARTKYAFGAGYPDSVWPWATIPVPGRAGYSAPTLEAFRTSLQGTDSGLQVYSANGRIQTLRFAQYAATYMGNSPSLNWLGPLLKIRSWSEYTPPSQRMQELAAANTGKPEQEWFHDPQLTLFDLLVNYEWLKFQQELAQRSVTYSQERPIRYQLITNPEFTGSGTDWKWLARLSTPIFAADEWFGSSFVADGAYYQGIHFTRRASPSLNLGVSLEVGSGGNAAPYHDLETSYALAYDLTGALNAQWLQADFLPKIPPKDLVNLCFNNKSQPNCEYYLRTQSLRAYGLGYQHAYEDQLKRPSFALRVVSSRSLLRPFSLGWRPWEWSVNGGNAYPTVSESLLRLGYPFEGVGEDAQLAESLDRASVVIYEPRFALQEGWEQLKRWLARSKGTAITNAYVWSKPMLTRRYALQAAATVEPMLATASTPLVCPAGASLIGMGLKLQLSQALVVRPPISITGWQPIIECVAAGTKFPVVSTRYFGQGRAVLVHLDHNAKPVPATEVLDRLYAVLLAPLPVRQEYQTVAASVHLYSGRNYQVAAVRSSRLNQTNASWRAPGTVLPVAVQTKTPNRRYRVRWLLSNQEAAVSTDKQGWLRFTVRDRNYELLFFQEASVDGARSRAWEQLRKRSAQIAGLFATKSTPNLWLKVLPKSPGQQ